MPVVHLRDLDGRERRLGVDDGCVVEEDAADRGEVIDLRRWWSLPGLVDAHAHLHADGVAEMVAAPSDPDLDVMARHAATQLGAGVTVLGEKGGKSDRGLDFLATDPRRRPDIHMAGRIIVTDGGYYPDFGLVVDPAQVEQAVSAADDRAGWVKLIGDWPRRGIGPLANFDPDQLAAAAVAAHARGKRIAVHTMAPDVPSAAVAAGVDSIEHGLFLTEADIEALGSRRGAWVPTVAAMETVVESLGAGSSGGRLIRQGLDNVRGLLGLAMEAGVAVLAGTDLALRHGEVAREAVRLRAYGLSGEAVVDAVSTAGVAYFSGREPWAPGSSADVVCFDSDPRRDITTLFEPVFIMRRGVQVPPNR